MLAKLKDNIKKYSKNGINYIGTKMKLLDEHPIYQLLIYSVLLVLVLEMLNRRSILKGLCYIFINPLMFLFNFLIILLTLSISILFKKKNFIMIMVSMIWIVLGVVNYVLLFFRTTPLTAMDFYLLQSVKGIISLYLNTFQIILIVLLFVALILGMIIFWRKSKKYRAQFRMSALMIGISALLLTLVSSVSLKVNARSTDFGNLADAYQDFGFTFCFSNSIFDRGIDEPEEYSEENVEQVLKKIETEPVKSEDKNEQIDKDQNNTEEVKNPGTVNPDDKKYTKPNIVVVQLESFFDVNNLVDYTFSENPIPNFTQLKKDFSHGYLTVPSIGAGTANTEFEILTGMNIEHFGAGEYPYKTILQTTTCESINYNLGELGYHSHAIHNNTGTFYDRDKVFQKLGFDSFSSIEYMNNVEYNPAGWAKDKILTTEILKAIEARATKDFVYTISVQPHGKYPETVIDENQKIKVIVSPDKFGNIDTVTGSQPSRHGNVAPIVDTEEYELPNNTVDNNIIGDGSAEAVTASSEDKTAEDETAEEIELEESYKNKIEYYVNQLWETDQFIGDLVHKFTDYKEPTVIVFFGDHLPSLDIEDDDLINHNAFQTEYVLWSNFPMDYTERDLNAYQLNAYIMERLGYDNGILTKFHQRYLGKPDYQEELKLLQYDMLYGSRNIYEGENPYVEKPIHMGVFDVEILNAKEKGEVIFVEGKNFTPWSVVYFDGEPIETLFIDEKTLIVPNKKYQGEEIYVAQVNDDKTVLSQSKIWNPH